MTSQHTILNSLLILTLVLALSCTQGTEDQADTTARAAVKVSYVDNISESGTARILIEGMSCERMCVTAIKKSVSEIPTLVVQDIHFDADKPIDTLIVKFDHLKVGEQEIIHAIESLAGGDTYHVKEVQLSKDAKTSRVLHINPSKRTKSPEVEANQYRFEVPNFLEILRRVSI